MNDKDRVYKVGDKVRATSADGVYSDIGIIDKVYSDENPVMYDIRFPQHKIGPLKEEAHAYLDAGDLQPIDETQDSIQELINELISEIDGQYDMLEGEYGKDSNWIGTRKAHEEQLQAWRERAARLSGKR